MYDGKPNNKYNDTLNANAEFFSNKSKIIYNKAQGLKDLYVDQCGVIQISIEIITISTGYIYYIY